MSGKKPDHFLEINEKDLGEGYTIYKICKNTSFDEKGFIIKTEDHLKYQNRLLIQTNLLNNIGRV